MGYTHYYGYQPRWPRGQFVAAMRDAGAMVRACQEQGIIIRGGLGEGEPNLTDDELWFNGDGSQDLAHETFIFPMNEELAKLSTDCHGPGGLWDFTKTARKPYDLAVCAVLLVLKHHLGEFLWINSDGDRCEEEWLPAERLVKDVLGYDLRFAEEDTMPWKDRGIVWKEEVA